MQEQLKKYKVLRNQIDNLAEILEVKHKNHMECKAGCDLCCMDYSVFPIEFYSILNSLKESKKTPEINQNATPEDCIFLNDHKCSIYNERPIICRTHGLPLLYMSEDGNWELSACELNFTNFDMNEFSEENTFAQDTFNSKLFLLNQEFIKKLKEEKYAEFDLIPLKEILNEL